MLKRLGFCAMLLAFIFATLGAAPMPKESSPLLEKAKYLQQDLIDKHLLEGLYVSIVPAAPPGTKLQHTTDGPGNVIHAGVWTGRYLAGVGYQYAVTKDPWARQHGGEILRGLRKLQEVTGKPGLLARGFVKGHGPVAGWETGGSDSKEWHQGQGKYKDYRWYGDVSVDNFNAVLYGYAIYYDLAADAAQKKFIAYDVDRLMTHLLDNHCRIVDVDGEVTMWGHVGIDPNPSRDEYYKKVYANILARANLQDAPWRPPLRSSLMLLPDLLIAHHITGKQHYMDFYKRVVARFKDNPDLMRDTRPFSLERLARVNHSSEGQAYEALYNLIRFERDPELLKLYRQWVLDLWEMNWMEGNSLFAFMTLALLKPPLTLPLRKGELEGVPHGEEGLQLANQTLRLYPYNRVLRPVMNSLRKDIELNPYADRFGSKQSAKPMPINQRPHDNEYEWKGNPYQLDGWFKPTVTQIQFSCDDPQVWWFCDSAGRIYMTLDDGKTWRDMSAGLMGAQVQNIIASKTRTFILYAQTDKGVFVTRDGGMSWRPAPTEDVPKFETPSFKEWKGHPERGKRIPVVLFRDDSMYRINDSNELVVTFDHGKTSERIMTGWRILYAHSFFFTSQGMIASGPSGCYLSRDGVNWSELKLWQEHETGAADYLHAYWMGRYYGLTKELEPIPDQILVYMSGFFPGKVICSSIDEGKKWRIESWHIGDSRRFNKRVAEVSAVDMRSVLELLQKARPIWTQPPRLTEKDYKDYFQRHGIVDGGYTLILKQEGQVIGGINSQKVAIKGYKEISQCISAIDKLLAQYGKPTGGLTEDEIRWSEHQEYEDFEEFVELEERTAAQMRHR